MRGDTGKLLLQIEELKKLGCNPKLLQFLKGYYYVNASQFREARHVLAPLEPPPGWPPQSKPASILCWPAVMASWVSLNCNKKPICGP